MCDPKEYQLMFLPHMIPIPTSKKNTLKQGYSTSVCIRRQPLSSTPHITRFPFQEKHCHLFKRNRRLRNKSTTGNTSKPSQHEYHELKLVNDNSHVFPIQYDPPTQLFKNQSNDKGVFSFKENILNNYITLNNTIHTSAVSHQELFPNNICDPHNVPFDHINQSVLNKTNDHVSYPVVHHNQSDINSLTSDYTVNPLSYPNNKCVNTFPELISKNLSFSKGNVSPYYTNTLYHNKLNTIEYSLKQNPREENLSFTVSNTCSPKNQIIEPQYVMRMHQDYADLSFINNVTTPYHSYTRARLSSITTPVKEQVPTRRFSSVASLMPSSQRSPTHQKRTDYVQPMIQSSLKKTKFFIGFQGYRKDKQQSHRNKAIDRHYSVLMTGHMKDIILFQSYILHLFFDRSHPMFNMLQYIQDISLKHHFFKNKLQTSQKCRLTQYNAMLQLLCTINFNTSYKHFYPNHLNKSFISLRLSTTLLSKRQLLKHILFVIILLRLFFMESHFYDQLKYDQLILYILKSFKYFQQQQLQSIFKKKKLLQYILKRQIMNFVISSSVQSSQKKKSYTMSQTPLSHIYYDQSSMTLLSQTCCVQKNNMITFGPYGLMNHIQHPVTKHHLFNQVTNQYTDNQYVKTVRDKSKVRFQTYSSNHHTRRGLITDSGNQIMQQHQLNSLNPHKMISMTHPGHYHLQENKRMDNMTTTTSGIEENHSSISLNINTQNEKNKLLVQTIQNHNEQIKMEEHDNTVVPQLLYKGPVTLANSIHTLPQDQSNNKLPLFSTQHLFQENTQTIPFVMTLNYKDQSFHFSPHQCDTYNTKQTIQNSFSHPMNSQQINERDTTQVCLFDLKKDSAPVKENDNHSEDFQEGCLPPTNILSTGLCQIHTHSLRLERLDMGNKQLNDSHSRDIHVIKIHQNPDIVVIPDFLTTDECINLIHSADGFWERSMTSKGYSRAAQDTYSGGASETRTSFSARLPKCGSDLITCIEHRVAAAAHMDPKFVEPLVVVRYLPGQQFNEHHDGFFRPKTVLIYLNDVPEGGETDFIQLGFKVTPQIGTAIIWSNIQINGEPDYRLRHAGLPPTSSTKYVVNCFLNTKSQIVYKNDLKESNNL